MLELRDLRAMLSPAPILAGAGALVIGLALAVIYGSTQAHRELRLLLLATAASALFATAILSAWGFWYLDSLWPAFAALSACGWSRLANQFRIAGYALAEVLPVQVVDPGIHRLVEEGPVYRRRWLDWGVFHVEPSFGADWQDYRRALQQRNAALKAHEDPTPWEPALARAGEQTG